MVKVLFFPKEQYPFERVRLTQLYQEEFTNIGNEIVWVVQPSYITNVTSDINKGRNTFLLTKSSGNSKTFQKILSYLSIFSKYKIGKNAISKYNLDIIEVCDGIVEGYIGYFLSRKFKKPFIFYLSHLFFHVNMNNFRERKSLNHIFDFFKGYIQKKAYHFLISKSVIFHPISERMEIYFRKDFPNKKMIPLPLCPSKQFIENYDPDRKSTDKINIVYVGKVNEIRNFDEIIYIINEVILMEKQMKFIFKIIGPVSAKYRKKLKTIIDELGLSESILFLDERPIAEIPDLISESTLGLSIYPPKLVFEMCSPTKAVEYLSLGIPVVGSKEVLDLNHVITESKGGLSVEYNRKLIAKSIIQIVKDPQKARTMGVVGREWVLRNRTYKKFSNIIDEEYNMLV